ncbi:unnamed protein product [Urochloa humidicola]
MATESEFVTAPSTPEAADNLEIVVEQRLRKHDGDHGESGSMSIFRVAAHVRDANSNKELYEPRLVSIGPYYRGRPALRAMEQHKWRYLHELLAQHPNASLSDFVRAIRGVEHRARRCYSERTDISGSGAGDHGSGGFGEMLLLDGCFILQFFIKWHNEEDDELCDVG